MGYDADVSTGKMLLRVSQLIMENQADLAALETQEHGAPIRNSMNFQVPQCAETFEYVASIARAFTGDSLPIGPWCTSITVHEPVGVVGLITPWNAPALMVSWKLSAALVTGNACIVKPASVTPLTTLKLAEYCKEAGIPDGVVNVITGPGSTVGEALVAHPGVARIGFTGDTSTGKRIMSVASDRARLTSGWSWEATNAMIVLADADLTAAVEGAIWGSFFNTGQVCATSGRLLVHESSTMNFVRRFCGRQRSCA